MSNPTSAPEEHIILAPQRTQSGYGLGITQSDQVCQASSDIRVSTTNWTPRAAGRSRGSQQTPEIDKAWTTTPSTAGFSGITQCDEVFNDRDSLFKGFDEVGTKPKASVHSLQSSPSWFQSTSERSLLPKGTPITQDDHTDEHASLRGHTCNSSVHFRQSMWSWPAVGIILLALFSTVLSGVFFFVAAVGPKYGRTVGTHGSLTASAAAFVTSLLAKLIEISFVTLVVALIGQMIARKAYNKDSTQGVTLAEMTMRSWAVQPGTIFSHWESVQYGALSRLGALTLLAAAVALLYTSAATALVQPQLKFGSPQLRVLQSQVHSSFANTDYLAQTCKSPVPDLIDDPEEIGKSCLQIQHASQAYHNYQSWMTQWTNEAKAFGNASRDLKERPSGYALLNDNTTITAPWIELNNTNMTHWLEKTGWMVNNVTMAMPHPGVVSAAMLPENQIMQPDQLDGLGLYTIRASVTTPTVNVLCLMGMTREDLYPLVDNTAGDTTDGTGNTDLDNIFHWGPQWGPNKWPPIFSHKIMPEMYNSIINDTTNVSYGRDAIYLLGRGGPVDQTGAETNANHALCSIRVGLTPQCSTTYSASSSGGRLSAVCEDPADDMKYIDSLSNATTGNDTLNRDWVNIGSEWARAISLSEGSVDANSSNARVWTQLFLSNASLDWQGVPVLSNAMPSPAEALAVMSGCTLLQSSQDAPFYQFWNWSSPVLAEEQTQYFNATVRAQQYASGGSTAFQRVFIIVLLAAFVINVFVLVYLLLHRQWYLDLADPMVMFPLALNSPPDVRLADSTCPGSPFKHEKFKHHWKLQAEGGHMYMDSPRIDGDAPVSPSARRTSMLKDKFEMATRPVSGMARRLRRD